MHFTHYMALTTNRNTYDNTRENLPIPYYVTRTQIYLQNSETTFQGRIIRITLILSFLLPFLVSRTEEIASLSILCIYFLT